MRPNPLFGFSDPFSSWSHLSAAVLAFVGSFFLIQKGKGNGTRVFALAVYSFSLVFLFSMSGVYHMLEYEGAARDVLQRLDHAAIWVLIAGTFTPVHIILFRGAWRWAILLLVWMIAITGLVLEVIFFKDFPEWLILSLFLGLGWIGALTGYKFKSSFHGESLKHLILGGIFYSFGAFIDFIRVPVIWPGHIGPHEIFHIFVMLGAFHHWRFVYQWADHPVASTLVFHITTTPGSQYTAHAIGDHLFLQADSIEELKALIKKTVSDRYHESLIPRLKLRYFNEENL